MVKVWYTVTVTVVIWSAQGRVNPTPLFTISATRERCEMRTIGAS